MGVSGRKMKAKMDHDIEIDPTIKYRYCHLASGESSEMWLFHVRVQLQYWYNRNLPHGPTEESVDNGTHRSEDKCVTRWLLILFVPTFHDQQTSYHELQSTYPAMINDIPGTMIASAAPIRKRSAIKPPQLLQAGISKAIVDHAIEHEQRYLAAGNL